jgi:hypothetical protein
LLPQFLLGLALSGFKKPEKALPMSYNKNLTALFKSSKKL